LVISTTYIVNSWCTVRNTSSYTTRLVCGDPGYIQNETGTKHCT